MTEINKYLCFKGIAKREEILFKSFLSLAKNDLPYKVIILKANEESEYSPDIIIVDDGYEFDESEQEFVNLPAVVVGSDHHRQDNFYVTRPVQWSEFRQAFTNLSLEPTGEPEEEFRVLPSAVALEISQVDSESIRESGRSSVGLDNNEYSNHGEYEYELDNLSQDYHSFTTSDYVKVVDDVKQFKEGGKRSGEEPVVFITDDQRASVNSVLVLETNSMDAWDFSHSEFSVSEMANELDEEADDYVDSVKRTERDVVEVDYQEEYWLEDNEIVIENESFMFIKSAREMVYSSTEPGRWPGYLQRKDLYKIPLAKEWRPTQGLGVYPLSSLLWVNVLITETDSLLGGSDENANYILERWPDFELLELDNVLLKLCTMLFVRPESVASLSTKSGYGRSTIRGLMNACHAGGYLSAVGSSDQENSNDEDGMLGKIKHAFS